MTDTERPWPDPDATDCPGEHRSLLLACHSYLAALGYTAADVQHRTVVGPTSRVTLILLNRDPVFEISSATDGANAVGRWRHSPPLKAHMDWLRRWRELSAPKCTCPTHGPSCTGHGVFTLGEETR